MRLAFWRADTDWTAAQEPAVETVVSRPAPATDQAVAPAITGDLELRLLGHALARRKRWIIVPTILAAVLSIAAVNLVTPRYKSEARILVDGRENVFLRPNGERNDERNALDPEAVTSQVQLLLSRDLARQVIKKNKLAELPEFDPVLRGISPLRSLLALFGIGRDPFSMTPEERVLDAYFDRLTAYAVDKSRVIVIEFQSRDPELAARVANSIADGYLEFQQNARQEQAKAAGQWLSGEIESLRKKVADAESRVEDFRSKSSLFIGTNNTSLSNQQMGELNTQLNNARALKSDAEAKARLIREMLQSGRPIEASEVLNSELMRRLSEQRVTLRAQLAEQSSTLLDGHPRIKELKAQLADLDRQIRDEAAKVSRSLENDARIAGGRVEGLSANLEQLKKQASSSNGQDVQLRALEREAKAQRDLLESYLAKYREATTRENIDAAPSDGRIISRAIVSNTPAYPKKLPIVLIATLASLMLSAGAIVNRRIVAHDRAARGGGVRCHIGGAGPRSGGCRSGRCGAHRRSRTRSGSQSRTSGSAGWAGRNRTACRGSARRRRSGAQDHHSRHRGRRQHRFDGIGACPPDRARGEGRGGRSGGGIAGDFGGVGRSCRAGPCGIDAGRSLLFPDHHQGSAVAGPPCQCRTLRLRPQAAAIAAARAGDRCLDSGL